MNRADAILKTIATLGTYVLNKAVQIYISARNMGFEPDGMTDSQMKELTDVFNLPK